MSEPKRLRELDVPAPAETGTQPATEQAAAPAAPRLRSAWRRRLAAGFGLLLLLAAAVPLGLWLDHRAAHVTTDNAIVRSHLAEVGARLKGVVAEIAVDAGDTVRKGQVLARLEDRHFRALVSEAEASVDALTREIEVERATIAHERRRVANLSEEADAAMVARRAELEAARSRQEDSSAFYQARKALLPNGAIATEVVRDAGAKARTSKAMAEAAAAEYAGARTLRQRAALAVDAITLREQHLGVLEARLAQASARLEAARADLESTIVRAPGDGAIVRRLAQPGTSTTIGVPLLSVWLTEDVWLEAWIPEAQVADIEVGSAVEVTLHAFPQQAVRGVVKTIGLTTDYEMPVDYVPQPRATRMDQAPVIGVGIRLENPPARMRPGMTGVVAIRRSSTEEPSS